MANVTVLSMRRRVCLAISGRRCHNDTASGTRKLYIICIITYMVFDSIPAVVNQCGVHAVKQHAQAPMAEVHVHNPRLLSTSDRSLNQCVPD